MEQFAFSERFERQEIPAQDFGHREHVQAAYELLQKYDFIEATAKYAKTIRSMATAAGAPEKFNVTITVAFMGLIAEKMDEVDNAFYSANPDLSGSPGALSAERISSCPSTHMQTRILSGNALAPWYSAERISSEVVPQSLPDARHVGANLVREKSCLSTTGTT